MMIAGTIATGETVITNEEMIHRGYDNVVKKLQTIGVRIDTI